MEEFGRIFRITAYRWKQEGGDRYSIGVNDGSQLLDPDLIRDRVAGARLAMRDILHSSSDGLEACKGLSDFYDQLIESLFAEVVDRTEGASDSGLTLIATGGWGRQELCPYSDIDFILLGDDQSISVAKQVADTLLYPLWDAGVNVGHAVRTVNETNKLAGDDIATTSALLDARHIAGIQGPVERLREQTRRAIAPGQDANAFVAKLGAGMRDRHQRFDQTVYLLEPNLKRGRGALRDLATAQWVAHARWGTPSFRALMAKGHISSRQLAILEDARSFLLRIRSLLQFQVERPTDQLTFEIQEAIAPDLYPNAKLAAGDIRPAVAPAVEALMRHYYLHARGAVQVTDFILERAKVASRRKPRIRRIDSTFLIFNGKIGVHDPQVFRDKPAEMVRVFRVAVTHEVPIYGHTRQLIADTVATHGDTLTRDPIAAKLFLDALVDPQDASDDALVPALLEEMHQLGVLNAVLPEFAPCTCRVQHDLYHVYTVDQHQLYTVAMLKRIARGELQKQFPTATEAYELVERYSPLYLATLLHDVGKPLGKGHAEKGARIVGVVGRRLRLSEQEVSTAAFLVRQHLTMSHLSQRRDLSDVEVIQKFAERVGTLQQLAQLYLLTLCDTAMTAPGNLNPWKQSLLRELYLRTRDFLGGSSSKANADPVDELASHRSRIITLAVAGVGDRPAVSQAETKRFLSHVDRGFLSSLSARQVARHVALAQEYEIGDASFAMQVGYYPLKGHSEVAIVAADVPMLLAAIAAAFAVNRVHVLGAVGSRSAFGEAARPLACDLFYVRNAVGKAIPTDDSRWKRIESDLTALLSGPLSRERIFELVSQRQPSRDPAPRVTPEVPTEIRFDNDASSDYTIAEVFTRDKIGVLYTITDSLAALELDVSLVKLSTEGEKVADVFYLSRAGKKIENSQALAHIAQSIAQRLEELGDA